MDELVKLVTAKLTLHGRRVLAAAAVFELRATGRRTFFRDHRGGWQLVQQPRMVGDVVGDGKSRVWLSK